MYMNVQKNILHISVECYMLCDLCVNIFHRPGKIINNKLDRKNMVLLLVV